MAYAALTLVDTELNVMLVVESAVDNVASPVDVTVDKLNNCPPLTASLLPAATLPSATPVREFAVTPSVLNRLRPP